MKLLYSRMPLYAVPFLLTSLISLTFVLVRSDSPSFKLGSSWVTSIEPCPMNDFENRLASSTVTLAVIEMPCGILSGSSNSTLLIVSSHVGQVPPPLTIPMHEVEVKFLKSLLRTVVERTCLPTCGQTDSLDCNSDERIVCSLAARLPGYPFFDIFLRYVILEVV